MRIIFIFFLCVSLNAQEIIWTHNSPIIRTFSSPRTTDLNNDGIKDIILGGGVEASQLHMELTLLTDIMVKLFGL